MGWDKLVPKRSTSICRNGLVISNGLVNNNNLKLMNLAIFSVHPVWSLLSSYFARVRRSITNMQKVILYGL